MKTATGRFTTGKGFRASDWERPDETGPMSSGAFPGSCIEFMLKQFCMGLLEKAGN